MDSPHTQQVTESSKWLRVARYFFICALIGLVIGAAYAIPGFAELSDKVKHSAGSLALVCLGMIAIQMTLVAIVGSWSVTAIAANSWKPQLLELLSFFWAIATANAIAGLLNLWIPIDTSNEGVGVLLYFVYFFVGCLVLLPFQWIAYRSYRKRKASVNGV
jgi:hypothetical protein